MDCKTLPTINMLRDQLGAISLLEAIEMLRDLDCTDEKIIQISKIGNTLVSINQLYEIFDSEFPAAGIKPLLFCGGPPGRSQWYTGNLLTLLIDRILYKVSIERVNRESYMATR